MVHNVEMVKKYLEYANDDLRLALTNLKKFVSVNNETLNGYKINNTIEKVKDQIDTLDKYIIPAAKKL